MIIPFLVSSSDESQDILRCGPSKWLESNKLVASFLYMDQPNPRILFSSSFSYGRCKSHNFFCRSYYHDSVEAGTERRGSLLTLGLASRNLSALALQWIYFIAMPSFLGGGGDSADSEEVALGNLLSLPEAAEPDFLAQRWRDVFGTYTEVRSLSVGQALSLPEMIRAPSSGHEFGALLLDSSTPRQVAYKLAAALSRGKRRLWPFQDSISTVLFRRSDDQASRSVIVHVRQGASGLAELSFHGIEALSGRPRAAGTIREQEVEPT